MVSGQLTLVFFPSLFDNILYLKLIAINFYRPDFSHGSLVHITSTRLQFLYLKEWIVKEKFCVFHLGTSFTLYMRLLPKAKGNKKKKEKNNGSYSLQI